MSTREPKKEPKNYLGTRDIEKKRESNSRKKRKKKNRAQKKSRKKNRK